MSFETGMVAKLQEIVGLTAWAEYAEESTPTPYIVYTKDSTEYERVLDGVSSVLDSITFELNLICDRKSICDSFAELVEAKLLTLFNTTVGGEYIQDIEILNRFSQYEPIINKHREIIEIKVSF